MTPIYPELITLEMLHDKKVCQPQIEIFQTYFPFGCQLSRDTLITAAYAQLQLRWATHRFLALADARSLLDILDGIGGDFQAQTIKVYDQYYHDPSVPDRKAWLSRELTRLYFEQVVSEANAIADFLELD